MAVKNLTIEDAIKKIAELEAEVKRLKEMTPPGLAGWLVKTPNHQYSGQTLGIYFRSGQAFIPDGEDAERIASQMGNDLGYSVTRVEDWRQVPLADTDQVKASMIDVLTTPQRV